MTRKLLMLAAVTLLAPGVAYGQQEAVGAGRVELESALLGGGAIYLPSMGPHSMGYVLNAGATANVDRWTGLEGDFAWAMSRPQALALYGVASANQRSPNMLFYTGNVVICPAGHHHRLVPYGELGGGAVSVLDTAQTGTFGLAGNSTHLTFNVGGGVRWFPMPHWGARADYRYIGIENTNPPTTAGVAPIRHAQRLYGALVLTF